MKGRRGAAWVAWVLAALFYSYQYALRAAPGVMIPQLSAAFSLSAVGIASLVGVFYYGYAAFSVVAGAAIDRMGARVVMPLGVAMVAFGAVLFGIGNLALANFGRLIQGAGGASAFVGAVYIASRNFAASRAATLIGATQMIGMMGGSAGQFAVGSAVARGLAWNRFWILSVIPGLLLAVVLAFILPKHKPERSRSDWLQSAATALTLVFRNPQSVLCGAIGGLLFIPTNIFATIWAVRFLQEAHGIDYGDAVMRSAAVPLGWMIGCPLLGFVSDRLGRRKPVILAGGCVLLSCLAWILHGSADVFPPYVLGIVAGVASGAAMIPYAVIKEANPPELSGTATGVMNLLTFTFSAVLGPVCAWIMQSVSEGETPGLGHYQLTFQPLLYGVGLAIVLTFALKETGPAIRVPAEGLKAA